MASLKQKLRKCVAFAAPALVFAFMAGMAISSEARAGEEEAKALLKAMTDYMAEQKAISFDYDAILELVTKDGQKLAIASSGAGVINRPNKIRAARSGGFADVEMVFDGQTLTVLGKNKNVYTQVEIPGSIDHLIDELKDKYNLPLPAADLLLTNAYDELMANVEDVKDLGSGVIGGTECDHLAFRAKDVDWQIWIAQGNSPHPCRYVITSKTIDGDPQYSIQITDWQTGSDVATDSFSFEAPAGAKQLDVTELKKMKDLGDLPGHFIIGGE